MQTDLKNIIEQFVDLLMPELTPYEVTMYLFLLSNSHVKNSTSEIRIGKRTISDNWAKNSRNAGKVSYEQVSETLKGLEEKGCLKIGDTNRDGTSYRLLLPGEISSVKEKLSIQAEPEDEDFFNKPEKRKELFERDNWTCHYCGEKLNTENVTLDHYIPQHMGGKHSKENLKTSCLTCNSIKSGKTYEEAAPLILKNMQERRARKAK
jgi:hypothetical protein